MFWKFFLTHPFIPKIFIEHLLCAKHSTRFGGYSGKWHSLKSLLLLWSWHSGWRQTNPKQRNKKLSESEWWPWRKDGVTCAQGALACWLSIRLGPIWHSRSQCENTNRNTVTAPPMGVMSTFWLWNTDIWVDDFQISLPNTSGWIILSSTVFLFYYLFILIQSFGISNFMKK